MDNVNNLLEGASPYQVLQEQAGKLASKWDKSGLLEGITSSTEKNNMSMLLENQAKQLVNESNTVTSAGSGVSITNGGNSEAWAGVALPLVRRVFGEIVAKDLVSVQPMNLPAGLIFYLDFQYGTGTANKTVGESLYGASSDLKRTSESFDTGLYGAGEFGYSTTSASIAVTLDQTGHTSQSLQAGGGGLLGILAGDTEFSASFAGGFDGADAFGDTDAIRIVNVLQASASNFDADAIRAFAFDGAVKTFPQYTRLHTSGSGEKVIQLVISGAATTAPGNLIYLTTPDNLNDRGDFEDTMPEAGAGTVSALSIPEINVQLRSETVAAKTRKLKAQWTPEFAQDLNAYHSIDAEAELTSILSEYISMEIDLEILDMLIRNADTVEGWSAKVAQDVSVNSNHTVGGTAGVTYTSNQNNLGVYYTKMSWFQTLGVKLQKVSNLIHQKTLRGGANWMVVSPKVSTILEAIPGFAADSSGDSDKYNMGVQKIGAINNRYTVYKNPYMVENTILMGYKGSQFLETGAVFAPYIPLIMTPLVYDPTSFTPRKGIMTRYAKKMVRPDFYGKVMIHDLNEL